jgi:D-3-phosphoglycerate dehydrogenase
MERPWKIVVADDRFPSYDEERAVLSACDLAFPGQAELFAACADADAILVNLAPIDAALIARMKRCKVIARYGVGYDNVDAAAAARAGIWVANVPGYCDDEVAEHALALLLDLARGISAGDRGARAGSWAPGRGRKTLSGSVLGVAGFGGTAKALIRKCAGLGFAEILSWSPRVSGMEARDRIAREFGGQAGVRAVGFDELLALADALSLHLPLVESTRRLIGAPELRRMKPGSLLVNVSRGGLIDESALAAALESGSLGGAGLDCFETEPLPLASPLLGSPSLVISPHTAFYSRRALSELKRRTAENALATLRDGKPLWPVNEPTRA